MNRPSCEESRGENEQDPSFKSRLELDDKAFNSASEALEAYIARFEGGPSSKNFYRRRPSDLLSPAPKFYFMDSVQRSLRSPPSRTPAKKVEELLEWVNDAYSRELSSKVQPFGHRTAPEIPGSDEENLNPRSKSTHHSHRWNYGDLSTLPSPSSSVVDLDSNAGTVETDVLLSSYKAGVHPSGSYSRLRSYRSPPLAGSGRGHARPDGSTEYPSWVSGLGKEYPSWVEDLDSTTQHWKRTKSPAQRYSSETSSSETDQKRRNVLRSSRSTPALKVSDLHSRAGPSSLRPKGRSVVNMADNGANEVDWNDGASTDTADTEILVSQPMYGARPINMGGNLHKPLYEDQRVARLKKESTKKLRKSTGRMKSREQAVISPRRAKSLSFTPTTKALRFSDQEAERRRGYSRSEDATPRATEHFRDSSPTDRSPFTVLPSRYSIPPQDERYGPSSDFGRRSASPRLDRMFVSPPSVRRYSIASSKTPEAKTPSRRLPQLSSSKTPISAGDGLKVELPPGKEGSDAESESTDRVMRKSPTGIRMEKMYRDPSTMYPWKSMMQSSSTGGDSMKYGGSEAVYHSTPILHSSREPQRVKNFVANDLYLSGASERSKPKVTLRDPRGQPNASYAAGVRSAPKPIFASSSFRSRDERPARSSSDARHRKPPPSPRGVSRRLAHMRSKTVPDMRRMAMSSVARPRSLRRSLDDDLVSVSTADTETLVTHPPMPVFDVSPSLTTVSDSDTMVESEAETEIEVVVAKRGEQSAQRGAPDITLQGLDDEFSPTSVFASTNPHAAVRHELPQRFHLWKLDEDTKASDSFIKKRFTSTKSGIISTFLEDCLNVNSDEERKPSTEASAPALRLSGKDAAPGPVEALKQMLFTMQDMAHHDMQQDMNGHSDYHKLSSLDLKSKDTKEIASDDQSDRDLDNLQGEMSLQRAYRHLERLKRLVGQEEDRSSVSSVS